MSETELPQPTLEDLTKKLDQYVAEFQILAERYCYEDLHCFYTLTEDLIILSNQLVEIIENRK